MQELLHHYCERCGLDLEALGRYRDFIHYTKDSRGKSSRSWCISLLPEEEAIIDSLVSMFVERSRQTIEDILKDNRI